jgi:type IV pilus assembly protein PilM
VGAQDVAADEGADATQAESPPVSSDRAVLYCNVGDAMNLAVARGRACLFTRVSAVGMETIATRLSAERGLDPEHARQWLDHVGLEVDPQQLEGDPETIASARRVLEEGVRALADELRLSLEYYGAQESAVGVDRIVLSGQGSAVAGLAEKMQEGLGLEISVARPPALAGYEDGIAARLTLPFGIALEA